MKQFKCIFLLSFLTILGNQANAQENAAESSSLSISGSVDAYFRTNLTTDNMIGGS
jgi:hypothetical protein